MDSPLAGSSLQPLTVRPYIPKCSPYLTLLAVENYPGFPSGILGPELMDKFREQSIRFGTTVITETVSKLDISSRPFRYWREDGEDEEPETADAIIIATGASAKRLGLKGEDTYWQSGISACAVCDGAVPIFRYDQSTRRLGMANSSFFVGISHWQSSEVATQQRRKQHVSLVLLHGLFLTFDMIVLTKYASHVYVLVRRDELRASKIMAKRLLSHPKVVRGHWLFFPGYRVTP